MANGDDVDEMIERADALIDDGWESITHFQGADSHLAQIHADRVPQGRSLRWGDFAAERRRSDRPIYVIYIKGRMVGQIDVSTQPTVRHLAKSLADYRGLTERGEISPSSKWGVDR